MPHARSTSSISPASAPFATRFDRFSAARWTTSGCSTRRSRSSSSPIPRLDGVMRRLPHGRSQRRMPAADAERARHAPPSTADADDASALGGGPMTPIASTDDRVQGGGVGGDVELQPARGRDVRRARVAAHRPGLARRRASCSFAGCTSACRAVGVREAEDADSIFDARCGPACRRAERCCLHAGCAARGGRRESCCSLTAADR